MIGPWLTADDKAAVQRVLDSGDLMSGKLVTEFEYRLADYFGRRYAVCVSSGTAALECAFVAAGEGHHIQPDGFVAIISAARAAGANPHCSTWDGTGTDILGLSGPAHGQVHDCSHSFHRHAPRNELACFSLNANKFVACCGGVVVTNSAPMVDKIRAYRNHGRDGGPEIRTAGRNLRMGEINAALGISQLKRIDEILDRRRQVAQWYDEITGQALASNRYSWFLYPVPDNPALARRHRTLADFRLFGTAQQRHYDTALLPIWPLMTRDECEAQCM